MKRLSFLPLLALAISCPNAFAITAGPDAFGYSLTDSTEPDGPDFAFVDILETGTQLVFPVFPNSFQADDIAVTIDLPHSFPFYGETLSQIRVSSNGYLSSDLTDPGNDFGNAPTLPSAIPSGRGGGARIYPAHDDLILDNFNNENNPDFTDFNFPAGKLGRVFVQSFDSLPTHPFNNDTPCTIIQWDGIIPLGFVSAGKTTFQVILFADGSLYFSYPQVDTGRIVSSQATIGIQNADATIGLLYSANQNSIFPDQAIAITLGEPIPLPLEITDFQVLDATSGEVSLSFNSIIGSAYIIEASSTLDFANPTTTLSIPASEVTSTSISRNLTVTPDSDFLRVREVEP